MSGRGGTVAQRRAREELADRALAALDRLTEAGHDSTEYLRSVLVAHLTPKVLADMARGLETAAAAAERSVTS